ncbi:MAG: hypothetical protein WBK48_01075 [Dethiobacteria bacterium]|jgi:hypothetical protein|nr:hypothetical protein [Bacillota bacterium]HOP69735.1 hypothetical protein [Bacillota bacterium]HPT33611.1 hypothetical protein [Bacillota bacterium]HPZ64412.1 hypothetical protein [Bacillota bacterium]HQD06245.1 hypothetical protein [Bacillota bacterium]
MSRAIKLILVFWLILSGSVVVLASPPLSVPSDPPIFSVVKTDTSKNLTVQVQSDRLVFMPGMGVGEQMYGFQPNSTYSYEDLCRLDNLTEGTIHVWYTLTGDLQALYEAGVVSLGLGSPSQDWLPLDRLAIEAGGQSLPINFTFKIPSGTDYLGRSLTGQLIFHAETEEEGIVVPPDEPETTPTDEEPDEELVVPPETPETPGKHPGTSGSQLPVSVLVLIPLIVIALALIELRKRRHPDQA